MKAGGLSLAVVKEASNRLCRRQKAPLLNRVCEKLVSFARICGSSSRLEWGGERAPKANAGWVGRNGAHDGSLLAVANFVN
jgi:hypothetical protein